MRIGWGLGEDWVRIRRTVTRCWPCCWPCCRCACGGGVQRDCRDSVDEWMDEAGDSCSDYGAGYYCTVGGQAGMGWNTTWGVLE